VADPAAIIMHACVAREGQRGQYLSQDAKIGLHFVKKILRQISLLFSAQQNLAWEANSGHSWVGNTPQGSAPKTNSWLRLWVMAVEALVDQNRQLELEASVKVTACFTCTWYRQAGCMNEK